MAPGNACTAAVVESIGKAEDTLRGCNPAANLYS